LLLCYGFNLTQCHLFLNVYRSLISESLQFSQNIQWGCHSYSMFLVDEKLNISNRLYSQFKSDSNYQLDSISIHSQLRNGQEILHDDFLYAIFNNPFFIARNKIVIPDKQWIRLKK